MDISQGTIAIVEDDAGCRWALRQLLRSAGYVTRTFDRAEAFLVESPDGVDCLIADVHLPEMTGVALLATLEQRGHALPAVLMTGQDDAATRELLRQRQGTPWLKKPFSDDDLFDAIEQVRRR